MSDMKQVIDNCLESMEIRSIELDLDFPDKLLETEPDKAKEIIAKKLAEIILDEGWAEISAVPSADSDERTTVSVALVPVTMVRLRAALGTAYDAGRRDGRRLLGVLERAIKKPDATEEKSFENEKDDVSQIQRLAAQINANRVAQTKSRFEKSLKDYTIADFQDVSPDQLLDTFFVHDKLRGSTHQERIETVNGVLQSIQEILTDDFSGKKVLEKSERDRINAALTATKRAFSYICNMDTFYSPKI